MKQRIIRTAVIGAGRIANDAHIPAIKALGSRVELTAVCSRSVASAEALARAHGIPAWYTDSERMLREQCPDLVCVCTSNHSHGSLSRLALENGAHVVCEKPLSINYLEAKSLFDCAATSGRALVACQNMRFNPDVQMARDLVRRGELGDIYYAEFTQLRRRGIPGWGGFHRHAENVGGCMCDLGVHQLDALLWILGNPGFKAITAFADTRIGNREPDDGIDRPLSFRPSDMDVEEFAAGSITLDNGCHVNFKISWAINLPDERYMRLAGTKAGLSLPEGTVYTRFAGRQANVKPIVAAQERAWNAGHADMIRAMADHIQFGAPLPVLPEETLNVTKILDAFYRSVAEHREVRADEIS